MSRRKAFVRQLSTVSTKGRAKTSSPIQDGDASIPRDRGNIDPRRRGFAELEKEKITLFDARGRSKSSSMYTGRSQMARIVKGASRGRGKILVRRKRIEVEGVSGSRQLFRQGRVVLLIRRGENDFSERGRKREKIWWKTRSREILWSLTEVSVESGLSGDEN